MAEIPPSTGGISFILEATAAKYPLATVHDTELWEKLKRLNQKTSTFQIKHIMILMCMSAVSVPINPFTHITHNHKGSV